MDKNLVEDAVLYTGRYIRGDFVNNPATIQEKLAHQKIFGVTPLMTQCTDKLGVRRHCVDTVGRDLCPAVLAEYDSPGGIDPSALPDRFVLKCNHGCRYNIPVVDKRGFNLAKSRKTLGEWLGVNYALLGYELQYHDIKRRCYAEEFVDGSGSPVDYKILCFNGEPRFVKAEFDNGSGKRINCYDLDFRFTDYCNIHIPNDPSFQVPRPERLDEMVECARAVSAPFDFVRVDFLVGNGRFYLGEMTFSPGNAKMVYRGDPETGLELGAMLKLSR